MTGTRTRFVMAIHPFTPPSRHVRLVSATSGAHRTAASRFDMTAATRSPGGGMRRDGDAARGRVEADKKRTAQFG